ncbi:circularly permuted type 2 ATP-grasp protein [Jatrophihabitans sp. DSM 45814]
MTRAEHSGLPADLPGVWDEAYYGPPRGQGELPFEPTAPQAGRTSDGSRAKPMRDEMFDAQRQLRPSWRGVGAALNDLGPAGLTSRQTTITRLLEDDGVSYRAHGAAMQPAWNLDVLPLVIDEDDWAGLAPSVIQRTELLDEVLSDLYGARRLIREGLLPPAVVFGHEGFIRDADRIRIPGPRQLFLSSTDLARDSDGNWRALADRTQAPSGAGFAMENRSVLSRALPGLYRGTGVHRIAPFFHTLRRALQNIAPKHGQDERHTPRVVLLSPGPDSETAFDQAFLSSLLGLPLTVAADLTVRDGRVWQRSLHRLERVDVILRRVDGMYSDPLELRPDSQLGVPGLVEAARNGSVSIVNSLGAGVLENPGLFPFLPKICQVLRGESLQLESARTWWCGDAVSRSHVLANLDHLVLKPLARSVGSRTQAGWQLPQGRRNELAAQIDAEPYNWVGQEPLAMSTVPTWQPGGLDPRPFVLRTFAVADEGSYELMPGGLSRAPLKRDSLVISHALGAISKDVWVLSASPQQGDESQRAGLTGPETVSAAVSPRVGEDLYWLGRYTERAESVSRLIRVVDNRWRDLHPAPNAALARCLATLLQTLTSVTGTWPGFVGDGAGARLSAPEAEIRSLIADDSRPGTLAHDLSRIRGLANAVRDQLSADTWTVLSGLDRSLLPVTASGGLSQSLEATSADLARLLQAMLAFSGLVAESMVRDTGWYLLDAGRRVERALQITGLLRYSLVDPHPAAAENLITESVLIAAESIITHRRRYPAHAGVDTVLELLLCDTGNPRALAFQLDRLEADLAQTSSDHPTPPTAPELAAVISRAKSRLTGADIATLSNSSQATSRTELAGLLDGVLDDLHTAHQLIEGTYFTKQGRLQPLDGSL